MGLAKATGLQPKKMRAKFIAWAQHRSIDHKVRCTGLEFGRRSPVGEALSPAHAFDLLVVQGHLRINDVTQMLKELRCCLRELQ